MAVKDQTITKNYALYNGDCIEVMKSLPEGKIDLSVHSPPFCGLYNYSSDERDLSNCATYQEFFQHYEFVVSELARATKPGRHAAVHTMEVPGSGHGETAKMGCGANAGTGLIDFPGDVIRLFHKCGFRYNGRRAIWNEPLSVRLRTMAKGLAHAQIVEDSALVDVASADYLLDFIKIGENKIPVAHPTGLLRYAGARQIPRELQQWKGHEGKQTENRYSHWIWRQYASAFWDDIRGKQGESAASMEDTRARGVLPYEESREADDERHVHPLQLDIIERACILWSNPGEVVLTPFMGVGSECYGAVINQRKAIGIELKTAYYRQAVKNMADAETHREQELIAT